MQLTLPHLTLPTARPLVPVEACMVLMDCDEDDVLHAVECGDLSMAFNIASVGAERREIRVWRDSLLAYLQREKQPEAELQAALSVILPGRDVRSTELQRLWSCSSALVHSLEEGGALIPVTARTVFDGPNSFTRYTQASVRGFLAGRRIV